MADSDNESDFASAESDQEEQVETTGEPPKPTVSETQKEKEVGKDQEELSQSTKQEGGVEKAEISDEAGKKEEPEKSTNSEKEKPRKEEQGVAAKGAPQSEEKDRGKSEKESEGRAEPVAPAAAIAAPTNKSGEQGGGGGGWGWGGWGKSLWSSVSTVTESAQALGHKVSSAIATVEDALGLPSPEEMAEDKDALSEELSKQADEMVEHDTAQEEERETVVEEPHKAKKEEEREEVREKEKEKEKGDSGSEEQSKEASVKGDSGQPYAGVSTFFSGIASMVQTTGKDFVSGGLDALENLGKKTMEVLTEGDPGLKEKRAMIGGGKTPTLSELLQEAKADSDGQDNVGGASDDQAPLSYSRLFDEYKGVVHLEALDLLSKECESKVRSGYATFSGERLRLLREKMEELTQAFEIEEEPEILDDDSSQLPEVVELFSDITLPIKVDRLMKVSEAWREKVATVSEPSTKGREEEAKKEEEGEGDKETLKDDKEGTVGASPSEPEDSNKAKRVACEALYENGLRSLAELTSASIELFRKMSEVSLLPDAQKNQPLKQAQKFNRLTVIVSKELDCLASVHSEAITELDLTDSNSCVTSLYLEASNSGSYVQDAFQLLLPVLKSMLLQQWLVNEEPSANVLKRN